MMILERIKADLVDAQKRVDSKVVGILRLLMSSLEYKKIEVRGESLSEDVEQAVLRTEAKKRREAIEIYEKAGDLVRKAQEEFELKIIEGYLPVLLSEEEVEKVVRKLIAETGKSGGQLIGVVMGQLKGKVDGSIVAKVVAIIGK
jgi:uncharacterized protein YqeY